jgi:hypothetical protein
MRIDKIASYATSRFELFTVYKQGDKFHVDVVCAKCGGEK